MDRRVFMKTSGAVIAAGAAQFAFSSPVVSTRKPNLLFVFADELAIHTMAAYGTTAITTPNFNAFAQQSIVFENAYVTQSVCTPSRSSIMTGLYPHSTGCVENNIALRAQTKCLPELGNFTGYRTGYVGKWHLGDEIFAQHGFSQWKAIEDHYYKYYSAGRNKNERSPYHHWLVSKGYTPDVVSSTNPGEFSRSFCAKLPEEHVKATFVADESCKFIEESGTNPFILYANFLEPHMPFTGPRNSQYPTTAVDLPPNFNHKLPQNATLKALLTKGAVYEDGFEGLALKTEADWRKLIARYWGLVSLVDTCFGKILNKLKSQNLENDTIVVLTSDHGDMMGSHKLLAKCFQYEEATRIPLIMRIPGSLRNATRVTNPVSQVDLVPTLLDYLEQPIPAGLQGYSWKSFLDGTGKLFEEDVFIEWNPGDEDLADTLSAAAVAEIAQGRDVDAAMSATIRTVVTADGYKFNWSSVAGENELFDLNTDPQERNNLIGNAGQATRIADCKDKIRKWQQRTGDTALGFVPTSTAGFAQPRTKQSIRFDAASKTLVVPVRGKTDIGVFNAAGRRILFRQFDGTDNQKLGMNGVAAGMYVAKISSARETRKFRFAVD